ncbi:MAG: hypothetical protein M0R66_06800 [Candidatus Omnitrophica bacterium]|jgi:hypothetical protein|nr:hypothetical protein [Candidatus Omnitrophota bacterium]
MAWLTLNEVRDQIGIPGVKGKISWKSVWRWIRVGVRGRRLPATKMPGYWIVESKDLDAFRVHLLGGAGKDKIDEILEQEFKIGGAK